VQIDRERALAHAHDIVLRAWEEFDSARESETPIADEMLVTLRRDLPPAGIDVISALDEAAAILDQSIAQSRPRYFGYIGSSGLDIGAIADLLAHSYDPNLAIDAGAATLVEEQALRWTAEFVGYRAGGGAFTSGGTVSNLTALAAARERAMPGSRVTGITTPGTIYCSRDSHYSITRAAELLGIGSKNVRGIAVDDERRMIVSDLAAALDEDAAAGKVPIAVIATAGTTLTGAVDPIDPIADVARERGVWLHVDGAYGAPAASVLPDTFRGLARADSLTVDAHKWMFVPKACGVVMVRDGEDLARTFGHATNYIPGQRNAVDATLEYSRPLRALKLWLAFRVHGADIFRQEIQKTLDHALRLYELADAHPLWAVGCHPQLSIVILRRVDVDNDQLVRNLQRDGRVYVSHAVIDGETWLRPCFTNARTSEEDVRALLSVADDVAKSLSKR